MDWGNWINFLIKWKSNIEMWNPLESETNVYCAANQHQTIELECVLFEFVSQNWTIFSSTMYKYMDLFSSWCQSKWWWLNPIIDERFRFDSIPWNIHLSIWNSYLKPSYEKISIFCISSFLSANCNSNPICDNALLLPVGEEVNMFPYYVHVSFFSSIFLVWLFNTNNMADIFSQLIRFKSIGAVYISSSNGFIFAIHQSQLL